MSARHFPLNSNQCPVCDAVAVQRRSDGISFKRGPSHRCTACNADLKTVATLQALWAIPMAAVSLGTLYLLIPWLKSKGAEGMWFVALFCAGFGLASGLMKWAFFRGLVFRPWRP